MPRGIVLFLSLLFLLNCYSYNLEFNSKNDNFHKSPLEELDRERVSEESVELEDAWLLVEVVSLDTNRSLLAEENVQSIGLHYEICVSQDSPRQDIFCKGTDVRISSDSTPKTTLSFNISEEQDFLNVSIRCIAQSRENDLNIDNCDSNSSVDNNSLSFGSAWMNFSNITLTQTHSQSGSQSDHNIWASTWRLRIIFAEDGDGDSVPDHLDLCADTASVLDLDSNGCSWFQVDSDGDGTNNGIDICPYFSNTTVCNSHGEYLKTSIIDFTGVRNDGLYYPNNWDISPNGENVAISLGWVMLGPHDFIAGFVVLDINNKEDIVFENRDSVIFSDEIFNARYNPAKVSVEYSDLGDTILLNDDGIELYTYSTHSWEKSGPSETDIVDFAQPITNTGIMINQHNNSALEIISTDGSVVYAGSNNSIAGYFSFTDDSESALVSTSIQIGNSVQQGSNLSIINLTTGVVRSVTLPECLIENNHFFLGSRISNNGLRIIVHSSCNGLHTFTIYERDFDTDGLVDTSDYCPFISGNYSGCPTSEYDSDLDGIPEFNDICSNTPFNANVNVDGCSSSQIDTDMDGIFGMNDLCPYTTNNSSVDDDGCALDYDDIREVDSDNDTIVDSLDYCSNTTVGSIVDSTGCKLHHKIDNPENSGMSIIDWFGICCVVVLFLYVISKLDDEESIQNDEFKHANGEGIGKSSLRCSLCGDNKVKRGLLFPSWHCYKCCNHCGGVNTRNRYGGCSYCNQIVGKCRSCRGNITRFDSETGGECLTCSTEGDGDEF